MLGQESKKVMIVDDDSVERAMLRYILEGEGYAVIEVHDEQHVIDLAAFHHPDLIIMDKMMPHRNGIDISIDMKSRISLSQIPIIMVTGSDVFEEKVKALEDGVEDYLCKPYEPRELLARVKAMLRSSRDAIDRNPSTLLPGARALEKEIHRRLTAGALFAMCHADLDNFKPYADSHGFSLANVVITRTGAIVSKAVECCGNAEAFVAHIGGDDFIILAPLCCCETVLKGITEEFDREIVNYFGQDELSQGYYMAKTREGVEKQFSIMTISIGYITNEKKCYRDATTIGVDLSTAKRKAKAFGKSNFTHYEAPIEEEALSE
jgi:DNA-binding response OmpR family regulator